MSERGRLSVEELKHVAWRLKSLRTLAGLNQENFSKHSEIPYMTLKGWELGRALPRHDGIEQIRRTMVTHGIGVTAEWIVFGSGVGPVYLKSHSPIKQMPESPGQEILISTFKKIQREKGFNPIVTTVQDDLMSPYFSKGDFVGGVYISYTDLKNMYIPEQIDEKFWLTMSNRDEWIVSKIFQMQDRLFRKNINSWEISECPSNALGRICFHFCDKPQI